MIKLGPESTPDEIRRYISHRGGREFLRTLQDDEGWWISPITGERFATYYQLTGHIGQRTRGEVSETPLTDDRSGYVKAIRRGEEPTDAQRRAHREYMREFRRRRRESKAVTPQAV